MPKGILKNSKVGTTWQPPPLAGADFPPEEPVYETPSPSIAPSPTISPQPVRLPGTVKNFTLIRNFTPNYEQNLLLVAT